MARDRDARERADDRKQKATTDRWTLGIAFGQAVLFVIQLSYMRRSLDDTKTAAGAAEKAATATEESVALARTTAQQQLRAYVDVVETSFDRKVRSEQNASRSGPLITAKRQPSK